MAAVDVLRKTERVELRDALRILGFIHRARGEFEAARNAYEEAVALGERGRAIGPALVSLAEGRVQEAADELTAALRAVPPSQPLVARQLLPYTVEALIAVGAVDEAAKFIDDAPAIADARAGKAQLAHATGLVRLAQGRTKEAREALTNAAEAWEEIGNRLECRRARVALLEATLSDGDVTEGLTLGRKLLEELGRPLLPRERDAVRRILRRAGVRTKPENSTTAAVPAEITGLTSREAMVLKEVAQGRTNREIARALGIAEKTVSVHVSHILAKLGCRTRTQAARFVPQ
jgi:DNA-binding CsgD family transcriptional regulator